MNLEPLRNIYLVNLKVKKHERVLVFTDTIGDTESISEQDRKRRESLPEIAKLLKNIGEELSKEILYFEYPALLTHGIEPPKELWELAFGEKVVEIMHREDLFDKIVTKRAKKQEINRAKEIVRKFKDQVVDAVIALSNFSTSHTNFRDLLTKGAGARYASMPLFDPSMLLGAMKADWQEVQRRGEKLRDLLLEIDEIQVETPNGTNIKLYIGKRIPRIDSGILTRKGSFGNLPAGEVFFAPLEGKSEGRLVIEWAPTRKLEKPLTLHVQSGKVVSIEGDEPYRVELERKLNERDQNRNIAELGFGINDKAKNPANILESEKILGTIHIALGDNSSFGGKIRAPFHQDFIFFNPTVYGTNRKGERLNILNYGKLLL